MEKTVEAGCPAQDAPDLSTPEKRAALIERLWAHDFATDVKIWPDGSFGPDAEERPFAFREKELRQDNVLIGDVKVPQFSFFPANGDGPRPAVAVFPGGGYNVICWNKEGTEIAQWLNMLGFSAFVLVYRTDDPDAALCDAQRTMGIVRRDAAKFGIDPARVGVIGFSAGANLAVRLATNWRNRAYNRIDGADDLPCRPDFMLPIYPWDLRPRNNPATPWDGSRKTFELDPKYPVDAETPPSFTAQALDDFCEPETAVALDLALRRAGVPSEIRIYRDGGHGYGLRRLGHASDTWSLEATGWLAKFIDPPR